MPATQATVFRNGGVFDGARHRRGVAVAVAGGRVIAVGPDAEVRARAGATAAEVDLAGGLLLPGFQDAHAHPVQAGLERLGCHLSGRDTGPEYLAAVLRYAVEHPEPRWIRGGGWSLSAFGPGGPSAADLDAVVPDRPVFLLNRDHHGAWVNSVTLRTAGIHRGTPDPPDGRLERDRAGEPTGTLHEGAMALVERVLPATSQREYDAALLTAQEHLASLGVTAWQDAILGDYAGIDDPSQTYLRAAKSGALTARVRGALWWDRNRGGEQVAALVQRRGRLARGRLSAGTVKVMQDGIVENGTAAMTKPYLDRDGRPTTGTGLSFVDPAALREHVTALDALSFQVHVHAIGDRAVREALDAFAAARAANGPTGNRHHIAHLQVVAPADRSRFADLDVTANIQPLWAQLDRQMTDLTLPFLDPRVAGWQYPFADLARRGARLAAGSDWPVSSPDPVQGIHVAVNRWAYDEPGPAGREPFLPDQALSLEQAMRAYTRGSAYVNHLDDTGAIRVGMVADLTVLDRDPFLAGPEEIGAASVVATYVDGRPVFRA